MAEIEGRDLENTLVEVPLGVAEDRLLGSVDAEQVLREAQWQPKKGLLEAANGGVLYVDEVNLLPDSLSDLLLDCSASGTCRLERDGLSLRVESRFILLGTMNPEEGELRPQLSDRFAHGVMIHSPADAAQRVEIARRSLEFAEEPDLFVKTWQPQQAALIERIRKARRSLIRTIIPEDTRFRVAERAQELGLEGMRAELAVLRTLRAAAAWENLAAPESRHEEEAWSLCLAHRSPPPAPTRTPPLPPSARPPQGARDSAPQPAEAGKAPLHPRSSNSSPLPLSKLESSASQPPVPSAAAPARPPNSPASHSSSPKRGQRTVDWFASLKASALSRWKPSQPGWRLIHRCFQGPRRVWLFLDASRSAGYPQSGDWVRGCLAPWLSKRPRLRVLLLHGGRLQWLSRDSSPGRASAAILSIRNALGNSPIGKAVRLLRRDLARTAGNPRNEVWICSDGMLQPEAGQRPVEAAAALGRQLRRTADMIGKGNLRWLAPEPSPAHAGWLPKLLRNTHVALFHPAKTP